MTKGFVRTVLGAALVIATATVAAAQPAASASPAPTDDWTFTVAPYLMLAGMSGTVGVKGYDSPVDLSASQVLNNLRGGFMGYFDVKKNGWGFAADTIYAKLGTTVTQGPVTIDPTATNGFYTLLGSRRVSPMVDLIFGARVTNGSMTLAFTAPVQKQFSQSKTWVDPVVGATFAIPAGAKAKVTMLADIGGFDTASTFSVDLFPALQIRVAKHAWLAVGYRYLYDDYSDGQGFVYKVSTQGPAFGLVIPF